MNSIENDKNEKELHMPLLIISCFALLRPIFSLAFAAQFQLYGLNLYKLFGTGFSIIFIFIALAYIKRLRIHFTSLAIVFYCFYCMISIIWGSSMEGVAVQVFPFAIFFAIRSARLNYKQNLIVLYCILFGYMIPIFGSALLIISGKTLYKTIYWTDLQRYSGLYFKIHTMAHSMFLYLVCLSVFHFFHKNSDVDKHKITIYLFYFAAMVSIYNIYKSYTRTVYLGFYAFLIIYLAGLKKYIYIVVCIAVTGVLIAKSSQVETIFFDVYDYIRGNQPIETVGSGRIGMWVEIIKEFKAYDFERKFLGHGLGEIGGGHNDILALLSTTGIMGLFLYLSILFSSFYEIAKSKFDHRIQYAYLGFIIAAFLMNILSNSYLSRFEAQQTFFFLLGIFFGLADQKKSLSFNEPIQK